MLDSPVKFKSQGDRFFFEHSCARHYNSAIIVIVRQRYLKERSGTSQNKSKQTPPTTTKDNNQSLTNRGEKVKQAQALTTIYIPRLSQCLQQHVANDANV